MNFLSGENVFRAFPVPLFYLRVAPSPSQKQKFLSVSILVCSPEMTWSLRNPVYGFRVPILRLKNFENLSNFTVFICWKPIIKTVGPVIFLIMTKQTFPIIKEITFFEKNLGPEHFRRWPILYRGYILSAISSTSKVWIIYLIYMDLWSLWRTSQITPKNRISLESLVSFQLTWDGDLGPWFLRYCDVFILYQDRQIERPVGLRKIYTSWGADLCVSIGSHLSYYEGIGVSYWRF